MKRIDIASWKAMPSAMILLCWMALASGCSEILSADISEHQVDIVSPSDSLFTAQPEVLFWWEEDSDIEQYRLQMAQPGFDLPSWLMDTSLLGSTVTIALEEGQFAWRVKGVNSGSETPFATRTLFVDRTDPDKAIALSLSGDTITGAASDSLQWRSQDRPISGYRHPVADSLYVSAVNDSTNFGEPLYFDFGSSKVISVMDALDVMSTGRYHWYLVTIDKAGNRRESEHFSFLVQ